MTHLWIVGIETALKQKIARGTGGLSNFFHFLGVDCFVSSILRRWVYLSILERRIFRKWMWVMQRNTPSITYQVHLLFICTATAQSPSLTWLIQHNTVPCNTILNNRVLSQKITALHSNVLFLRGKQDHALSLLLKWCNNSLSFLKWNTNSLTKFAWMGLSWLLTHFSNYPLLRTIWSHLVFFLLVRKLSCPRTFAHFIPSTWNTFALLFHLLILCYLGPILIVTSLEHMAFLPFKKRDVSDLPILKEALNKLPVISPM
jgi:hypothetical protein